MTGAKERRMNRRWTQMDVKEESEGGGKWT